MRLFGLTGGIGMGKSMSATLLRERGIAVVDTDTLARQLVEPGETALTEIHQLFGDQVIAPDGRLRRDELARRVFGEAEARRKLEAILHPRIRVAWLNQVEAWRAAGGQEGVVVIPLLFETHAAAYFDSIVCVACTAASQLRRLRERGWTDGEIRQRIAAQWPVEEKIAPANYVVWTEAGMDIHAAQLGRIFGGSFRIKS